MRAISIAVVLTSVGVALGSTAAFSQSLGELAERQKAKRKGESTRVITDEDLAKRGGSAPVNVTDESATPAADGAQPTATPAPGKSEDDRRAERQKDWEKRRADAEAEVARLTTEVEDAQAAVSNRGALMFGPRRADAVKRLEQAQERLDTAKARLDALDEERRREGY